MTAPTATTSAGQTGKPGTAGKAAAGKAGKAGAVSTSARDRSTDAATSRRQSEKVADRLLASSARVSFDPITEIDWAAELDPTLPAVPLEKTSLYGTELWRGLSEAERVKLSWQEFASTASVGLWFEMILMQMLVRYAYDRDPRSSHWQYALTEIGDETRHSIMFARAAAKLGEQQYGVPQHWHQAGRFFKTVASGPAMFAATLVAEETLDMLQRECLATEGMLPFAHEVCRIHVTEEARHVSYARDALARQVPKLNRLEREWAAVNAAVTSWVIVDSFIDPACYAAVGIDPAVGKAAARSNPHYRETKRWSRQKITSFLAEQGMVEGAAKPIWKRAGLV